MERRMWIGWNSNMSVAITLVWVKTFQFCKNWVILYILNYQKCNKKFFGVRSPSPINTIQGWESYTYLRVYADQTSKKWSIWVISKMRFLFFDIGEGGQNDVIRAIVVCWILPPTDIFYHWCFYWWKCQIFSCAFGARYPVIIVSKIKHSCTVYYF